MCPKEDKLKRHMSIHVSVEHCKCATCAQPFPSKKQLINHEVDEHGAETQKQCEVCQTEPKPPVPHSRLKPADLTANPATTQVNDKWEDEDVEEQPRDSNDETKNEKQEVESPEISEIENFHDNIGSYTCPFCDKQVQTKHKLHHHVQSMHVEKQNFPCGKCSHQFRNRSSIDKHTLGHQEPMRYSCTYYQKLCKIKQLPMEHVQRIHVEKRKFSCE